MEDWAEVHRLFHREGRPKAAIARQLEMSRTVHESGATSEGRCEEADQAGKNATATTAKTTTISVPRTIETKPKTLAVRSLKRR